MNATPTRFTLITAARLLDGGTAAPIEKAALLIEGDRIAALGPRRARSARPTAPPSTAEDYGAATILPGLVDAHTHLVAPGDGTLGRRHREGRRRHPAPPGGAERPHPPPLRRDHAPRERRQGHGGLLAARGHPPPARPGAAHGHLRAADHDHGRAHGLLRLGGRRRDGRAGRGPQAAQGGRRLHQDRRERRLDAHLRSEPRLVHRGRARRDDRRGAPARQAHRRPLHLGRSPCRTASTPTWT